MSTFAGAAKPHYVLCPTNATESVHANRYRLTPHTTVQLLTQVLANQEMGLHPFSYHTQRYRSRKLRAFWPIFHAPNSYLEHGEGHAVAECDHKVGRG